MTTRANDADNLSRIREILLGSQLEIFESDLVKTREEMSDAIQGIENSIQRLQEQHRADIQNLTDELLKQTSVLSDRIAALSSDQQEVRLTLESSFKKVSSRLSDEVAGLNSLILKNRAFVDEQLVVLAELDKKLSRLQNSSVNKKQFSAILNQLAMELLKEDGDE